MSEVPTNEVPMSKEECTVRGARALERVENGFDRLVTILAAGHAAEMMDTCELHELQNKVIALKYQTLGLHCRLTRIAQRCGCDVPGDGGPVPTPQGGGGGR